MAAASEMRRSKIENGRRRRRRWRIGTALAPGQLFRTYTLECWPPCVSFARLFERIHCNKNAFVYIFDQLCAAHVSTSSSEWDFSFSQFLNQSSKQKAEAFHVVPCADVLHCVNTVFTHPVRCRKRQQNQSEIESGQQQHQQKKQKEEKEEERLRL